MTKFGVDTALTFKPIRIAVLTVSDTRNLESDTSGALLVARLEAAGHVLADRVLLRDDLHAVRAQVRDWIDQTDVDVILTTGGTGLTGRDVTVEAVRPLFKKEIDGFSVIFHMVSYEKIGLSTLQSRACAGLARGTLIFCLPGSNGAVTDGWDKIIRGQLDSRYKPCNFVGLMPRLSET